MFDLDAPGEGEILDADWIEALVRSVNAARIATGDGADIIPATGEAGTSLRLSNLARYQARPGIVETQASAATTVSGKLRAGSGYFYFLNPVDIDDGTTPPTIDFQEDAANTVPVPFYNLYKSGASPVAGKLILVAPSPWGWLLATGDC
jgi:hypothetical protein